MQSNYATLSTMKRKEKKEVKELRRAKIINNRTKTLEIKTEKKVRSTAVLAIKGKMNQVIW